uniref:2Fe-2S iron-sulfur cluster-binding protein n=1 Tax=Anaerostipes caccae TaxID=105841 RepID=UPI0011C98362
MSYMTINNRRVEFTDEKNVLSVIRKSGIDLPTFCYHSELSTYGARRNCMLIVTEISHLLNVCGRKLC